MPAKVNVAGVWKDAVPRINVGGVWKIPKSGWVNVNGVWKAWFIPTNTYSEGVLLGTYQDSLNLQPTYSSRSGA